jgi:hypothetical protein
MNLPPVEVDAGPADFGDFAVPSAGDLRDIRQRSVSNLKEMVIAFLSLKPVGSYYRPIAVTGSSALKTVSDIAKDWRG